MKTATATPKPATIARWVAIASAPAKIGSVFNSQSRRGRLAATRKLAAIGLDAKGNPKPSGDR